jgi:L-iditol 2-dehydrogenase
VKLAQITGARAAAVADKPMPRIRGTYALVKVIVAPMCNEHIAYSDLIFRDRNRLDSLGHEAAGEIVEAGPDSRFAAGDRVVVLSGYPCGRCPLCRGGCYAHCESTVNPLVECDSPSGECAFAQYMIKDEWLLVPIPEGMSYEHASMACCGLGATFTALENMAVAAGETVLVTGLGPVGLGAILNARARGARVIGAARNAYRSQLARELGAAAVVDPRDGGALQQIRDLTGGRGVDCAIECTAVPAYQRLLLDATRRKGRVTFLAESGELAVHIDNDIIQKGLTVFGSLDLYLSHVPKMMDTIAALGPLIDRFITHRFPLDAVRDAWELQLTGDCGKIVLYPWS